MKKLAFFFIILISLVIVAGCNRSNSGQENPTEATKSQTETTVKTIEEEPNTESIFSLNLGKKEETVEEKEIEAKEEEMKTDEATKDTKANEPHNEKTNNQVEVVANIMEKNGKLTKTGNPSVFLLLLISSAASLMTIKRRESYTV